MTSIPDPLTFPTIYTRVSVVLAEPPAEDGHFFVHTWYVRSATSCECWSQEMHNTNGTGYGPHYYVTWYEGENALTHAQEDFQSREPKHLP